ncbi:MAG TPA: CHRD domain-containing protein [Rhizomicrobium sp.]|jgi:hypothetical protein|nr:CHRD domain-containing protein [Rhizomicrobium sp.]
MMRTGLAVMLALLWFADPAAAAQTMTVRLSPGPRLVGTRAERSGVGSVTATLDGSKLTISGTYEGLLGAPTGAHLFAGSAPGVRGPKVADLSTTSNEHVASAPGQNGTDGHFSGSAKLNRAQFALFRKGGLYVEIDSADAPDGDLWGWLWAPAD